MADDSDETPNPEELLPGLSEDRPLDGLVPEMNESPEHDDAPGEVGAVHPRVLEVGLEEGREWTLACWWDPGPEAIGRELEPLIDATLLRAASRLPRWEVDDHREYVGLRLFVFGELEDASREGLEALAFETVPYRPDAYTERMEAWRNEAEAADLPVPTRPRSMWRIPFEHPDEQGGALMNIESEMLDKIGDQVWGETPGAMSRFLAEGLEARFDDDIGLDLVGLETIADRVFASGTPSSINWTRPVFFQAVCDFVGVLLHGKYGVEVQWGMCEPDERGNVPPPMFRHGRGRSGRTVPVGKIVQDVRMLPARREESLAEVVDELARSFEG